MSSHSTKKNIRVLVIDDDRDVCELLEKLLAERNYHVTCTTDPTEAISVLNGDMSQIILLDIIMPVIDGIELLKKIREVNKSVCVIFLTAYSTFDHAVGALRGQAFDFLTKPFDIDELTGVLERASKHYGLSTNLNQEALEQIAHIVRMSRTKQKLSIRELASRTGLSGSLISQVEHAQSSPSIATISRFAAALDVPLEEFFKGL